VGAKVLRVDRQTEMTKLIVAFGSFADSSQKYDVRVTANFALNVVTLCVMDLTFIFPRRSPMEGVIGLIRSGKLGLTCKNAQNIWMMLTAS
jgi:hypothetical protein